MEHKTKILETAKEMFMRFGTRSITMEDIARELVMSKKTLYQYFKDKDEMVLLVTAQELEQDKAEIQAIQEASVDAIDEILRISQTVAESFKNMNPTLLHDIKKYHTAAWQAFIDYKNQFIRRSIIDNLTRGIDEGYYRADLNIDLLAIMRLEQVEMGFDVKLFPPDKFTLVDIQLAFLDHFVRGLLTNKGFEKLESYRIPYQNDFLPINKV
ncbi:MAG TPA: TetR/AcrR family transcriptional regulator [Microscillaceae bacterium]|nr:TetR/AcrR family transcriptional regulator [Microscillaceae bacterium]